MSSNHSNNKKRTDELQRKLEEIEARYVTYNTLNRNDGVNYWRGKKIISLNDWAELLNVSEVLTKGSLRYQYTKQALEFFPNDYSWWLTFPNGVEAEFKEEAYRWKIDYMQLMKHRNNPKCAEVDMEAYVKQLTLEKDNPNWRQDEYWRECPDAKYGPWNSYGFD